MPDFSVELVNNETKLKGLIDRISSTTEIALDIETINWWNRHQERIALIQLAYRTQQKTKVAIIDALAEIDLKPLRQPLELSTVTKAIHNAAFDATKLANHYQFKVAPIHDTMAAARRNGERRYSLQAQAETHLKMRLDKTAQRSDWSRRPLDARQIHYAALDAFSTFLLYENQIGRNLNGAFYLKNRIPSQQSKLPLSDLFETDISAATQDQTQSAEPEKKGARLKTDLSLASQALLGIVAELPTRYHPDQLAVSVGTERVGLAGWIVDGILGKDSDLDEETAKLGIADLCERNFIKITETRRLEATDEGKQLWAQLKTT